jgi:hypothetical protein
VIPATIEAARAEFEQNVEPPGWPTVYLRRGDVATASVFLSDWCTPRRPARWTVQMPSMSAVYEPAETATPPCPSEKPSTSSKPLLLVGPAQPHPLPTPEATYPLSVTIHAPATATAGKELDYTVTLTNTSKTSYRFPACPAYNEAVAAPGTKAAARYVLNCSSAGDVAPGASVTFEMVLKDWFASRNGEASLFWGIEGTDAPGAHVPIVVAGA